MFSCLRDVSREFELVCVLCSLEEECEASLCTTALASKNRQLQKDMKKLTAVFQKLKSYVALLALPSECVCECVYTCVSVCVSVCICMSVSECICMSVYIHA